MAVLTTDSLQMVLLWKAIYNVFDNLAQALELSLDNALNRFDHKGMRMHRTEDNSKLPLDNSAHLSCLQFQSTEIKFNATYKTKSNLGRRYDLICRRCDLIS